MKSAPLDAFHRTFSLAYSACSVIIVKQWSMWSVKMFCTSQDADREKRGNEYLKIMIYKVRIFGLIKNSFITERQQVELRALVGQKKNGMLYEANLNIACLFGALRWSDRGRALQFFSGKSVFLVHSYKITFVSHSYCCGPTEPSHLCIWRSLLQLGKYPPVNIVDIFILLSFPLPLRCPTHNITWLVVAKN